MFIHNLERQTAEGNIFLSGSVCGNCTLLVSVISAWHILNVTIKCTNNLEIWGINKLSKFTAQVRYEQIKYTLSTAYSCSLCVMSTCTTKLRLLMRKIM